MAEVVKVKAPAWDDPEMIYVVGALGPQEVPAIRHPWCPGLAVTMYPFGQFGVTHVVIGMKMGALYERCGSAAREMAHWQQVARAFGFTWEMDADGLRAAFAEHKDKPVPFEGATSTSMGETRPVTLVEWRQLLFDPFGGDEFPWEEESPWYVVDERLLPTLAPTDTGNGPEEGQP